jgi:hypothetical protein
VPGAGQYALGQKRWIAYIGAEIAGWMLVLDRRHDAHRLRDHYRELAWSLAREGLSEAPRMEGDFRYYETLTHWERSGSFDLEPGLEGVQPETDPATFNGSVWALATDIYFPSGSQEGGPGDPIYDQALAFYTERAYATRFLWDWSGHPDEWARYGGVIEESDDRFRQATLVTGLVMVNHLLSAVDAFVSARLDQTTGGTVDLSSRIAPASAVGWGLPRLDVSLRVGIGPR